MRWRASKKAIHEKEVEDEQTLGYRWKTIPSPTGASRIPRAGEVIMNSQGGCKNDDCLLSDPSPVIQLFDTSLKLVTRGFPFPLAGENKEIGIDQEYF